jgi:hypothetical protein
MNEGQNPIMSVLQNLMDIHEGGIYVEVKCRIKPENEDQQRLHALTLGFWCFEDERASASRRLLDTMHMHGFLTDEIRIDDVPLAETEYVEYFNSLGNNAEPNAAPRP